MDRAKDIVISGGENISTVEVEHTFSSHPAVAVIAVPDERWGERPKAFVCEWSNYLAHLDRAIWRYPRPVTTLWRAHTASGDRPGRPM